MRVAIKTDCDLKAACVREELAGRGISPALVKVTVRAGVSAGHWTVRLYFVMVRMRFYGCNSDVYAPTVEVDGLGLDAALTLAPGQCTPGELLRRVLQQDTARQL
ncbi:MAG: hypothetical protein LBK76_09895 [Verrucomicrobiales bacterium]|jgi:hypothetical protein|nr:hypothetical protein [Verrucomicrobiales bacterium]